MKSLKDLEAIREKAKQDIGMRETLGKTRIVVGMATCGIAAGARAVLAAFNQELETRNVRSTSVTMTGCVGVCRYEPMCDVIEPNGTKTTYVLLNADKAKRIVAEHIVNGHTVDDYTIGAAER